MKYLVLLSLIAITSCKQSDRDDLVSSCEGFYSPGANIYVRNYSDNQIIDSATVVVNSIGESESQSFEARFIDGDDGLSNSEDYAYYTEVGINEANWLINFHVSAPGYVDFQSEDYEFIVNTSCMGINNFVQEIALCPADTSCP